MIVSNTQFSVAVDANPQTSLIINDSLQTKCINIYDEKAWKLYTEDSANPPFAVFINVQSNPLNVNLELIEQALAAWPVSPIIGIADYADDTLVEEALAAGAHDFIAKPLRPCEIRSRTLSRRRDISNKQGHSILTAGDIMLDMERAILHGPKGKNYLSRNETLIISFLMNSFKAIVPRQLLKQHVWKNLKVTDNALNRKIFDVKNIVKQASASLALESIYGKGIILQECYHS